MTGIAALLVLAWARLTHKPWRELGFVRPRNWPATVVGGIVFGVALKLVMKAVVMPLLGAPAFNSTYHYLVGNTAALPGIILTMLVVAGFGEEVVFRGFLFDRARRLFGSSPGATAATVVVTSVIFAAGHIPDQGLAGAQQALLTGLVLGTIYARTRSIWLPMILHASFDLTAVAIIYLNLEAGVARLIFR